MHSRGAWVRALAAALSAALLGLAACNGTAVVTLTSTPSQDDFLAYRVGLAAVELESSSGKSGLKILPASTTVDLATLTGVSEVLGAAAVAKGSYASAIVTLDYSSAQIVYDDGTLNGVTLTPVGANGKALGQIQLTVNLDPGNSFSVAARSAAQLAMNFNLAASNAVNLSSKTVTVTPMMVASAMPIDNKRVRIRGPFVGAGAGSATSTGNSSFTMGISPFNGSASGAGQLAILTGDATTYEVNGSASTGAAGFGQIGALSAGTLIVAYGTLTTADTTTSTTVNGTTSTASASDVSFTATQLLGGGSVQGAGLDRVSGIVSARSGDTLTVEDGTLLGNDGSEVFVAGTTTVNLGAGTQVTFFGQGALQTNTTDEISVGSTIDAFGLATSLAAGNVSLDASAGRVRIDNTAASGLVNSVGAGTVSLDLVFLGGRAVAPFDFIGSGAAPGRYLVNTGTLDLANAAARAPLVVTGLANSFGVSPPNFTAATLLDPTTIQAELIVDWGKGTAAPFTTFDSSAIDLDIGNAGIGARHQIGIGAQTIDVVGLSSDPLIVPNSSATNSVFAIGHAASATVETFNTYAAFVAQLQTELNGTNLATGMTAVGQYTAATFTFSATSVTIFLND
jgi:hypothetical protein